MAQHIPSRLDSRETFNAARARLIVIASALLALATGATGCCIGGPIPSSGSSLAPAAEPSAAPAAPAADGLTAVPNSAGLRARVPEGVTPNGIGGAAGFHTDDDSFSMILTQGSGTIDEARSVAAMLGSVRSVRDEVTPDGFVFVWEGRRLDDQMQPTDVVVFKVHVQRNIGTTPYDCSGSSNTEEGALRVVEACQSVVGG